MVQLSDICASLDELNVECDGEVSSFCNQLADIAADCQTILDDSNSPQFAIWLSIVLLLLLIVLSGLFSGLTLGLLGLDIAGLEVIIHGGTPKMRKYARRIMTVRKYGNQLLCTLLLGNVAVNAALAIFLDSLFSGIGGFLASTALIVTIGEIIPQAVCARHALKIGAHTIWLVRLIMFIMCPLAYPIAKSLDCMLGKEIGTIYNNEELKKLIEIHLKQEQAELQEEAAMIMSGALDFGKKQVQVVMTKWEDVFTMDVSEKLNFDILTTIFKSGYSRIPCLDQDGHAVGLLFVKDLILLDPSDETPVATILDFYNRDMPKVFPDESLSKVMNDFRKGKSHLSIVHSVNSDGPGDPFYFNVGIITLEDIIETILNVDIVDETDVYIRIHEKTAVTRQSTFDVTKLNIFDYRRQLPLAITPQEAQATFYHLSRSISVFKPDTRKVSKEALKFLINGSIVTEVLMDEDEKQGEGTELERFNEKREIDISDGGFSLYRRGIPSEYFTVVLDGIIRVEAGRSKFVSEHSRWTTLCEDALPFDENVDFEPDFSAFALKNTRILRISRGKFREAIGRYPVTLVQSERHPVTLCQSERYPVSLVQSGSSGSGSTQTFALKTEYSNALDAARCGEQLSN